MKNPIGRLISASYRLRGRLARALHRGPIAPDQRAQTLHKTGVLNLKGLLAPADLEMILAINRDRFDRSHAKDLLFSPDGARYFEAASVDEKEFARYQILHIKHYHRKLDVYRMLDPLISPILKAYYRSHYFYRDLVCCRTQAPGPSPHGGRGWKRDNDPPGCLKVTVYLTDVLSDSSGPLVYAPGTHAALLPEGKREWTPCLGPRGTVIIYDNNGVHRAFPPAHGHSETITATVLPCIRRTRPRVRGLDLRSEKNFWKKFAR